jgi:hypothetical protein
VAVSLDGQPREVAQRRVQVETSALADGPHTVEVTVHDTSRRQNPATATWSFTSDNSGPRLEVSVDPVEGPQEGRTVLLKVRADEPIQEVAGTFEDRPLPLQAGAGGFWAVAGITPGDPPGQVDVQLTASDALGNTSSLTRSLPVRRTVFAEDDLDLDPATVDTQARAEENARLAGVYARPATPPRWAGPFRPPVQGAITTEFGTHRSYEYHPGADFAVAMGAAVLAPAGGTVAFVGELPARGAVVVLDHGGGVFTTYAHLQRSDVQPGAVVRTGQPIGRAGTSGFSTGPHLHWEVWVNGANVDPLEWTRRAYP